MLGITRNSKCPLFSSHVYLVNIYPKIKSGTMVLITCGASYILPDIGHDISLTMYVVPSDIGHNILLATYVVLDDIGHNIPFTMGFVQHIYLSVFVIDIYFAN